MSAATEVFHLSTHRERLEYAWNVRARKVDWIGLESAIRDVYADRREGRLTDAEALDLISEYVGAFTRRGEPARDFEREGR